jgi:hypothetical protein
VLDLRLDEYESFTGDYEAVSIYDNRFYTENEGIVGIGRTLFICILLTIGSIYFTKDANVLVLQPIERMIEKVKLIAKNPMLAASEDVEEAGFLGMMDKKEKENKKKDDQQYETDLLEKAIIKIGHLLALGFGEAGS